MIATDYIKISSQRPGQGILAGIPITIARAWDERGREGETSITIDLQNDIYNLKAIREIGVNA